MRCPRVRIRSMRWSAGCAATASRGPTGRGRVGSGVSPKSCRPFSRSSGLGRKSSTPRISVPEPTEPPEFTSPPCVREKPPDRMARSRAVCAQPRCPTFFLCISREMEDFRHFRVFSKWLKWPKWPLPNARRRDHAHVLLFEKKKGKEERGAGQGGAPRNSAVALSACR